MSELISTKEKIVRSRDVVVPMAARAIALCEGCPMAKFCKVEGTGDCPPPEVLESAAADYTPVSYKNQLMDDSVNTVMANLKPKPIIKPPQKPVAPKPVKKPVQNKPRPQPIRGETVVDAIAEAIIAGLGMTAVTSATK